MLGAPFRDILKSWCEWWLSGLIFNVDLCEGKFVIHLSNSWTYLDVVGKSIFRYAKNDIQN
ncbi:hypothetical protein MIZ03_3960 [Rhodoferax lithotrophicus]|uniref:Uncharacterized protein n=1 Tax=Rhodoferax lithotrophicus TaxID=2798804 RepID=A0ABM7MRP3_9BURK|nr:hypothetical protein MIZ03_3960 [Rhodoferax sp. MIZ03]